MNNIIVRSLLLILLIQCGLVAALYWAFPDTAEQSAMAPMVAFNPESIDEIHIGDEYENEAVLLKVGERWSLRDLENLPADPAMVDRLLSGIADDHDNWPIAQSIEARGRFHVASDYYQRRVRLLSGGRQQGTIYLGTSPGYRKVHARNAAQDAIYSINLNSFDAPGNNAGWLNRRILQIRTPLSIVADSYSLQRQGNDWQSGIGNAPDKRELKALLSTLRSLQVEGVATQDIVRDLAEPDLTLEVESLEGQIELELFHHESKYFIHSSRYPFLFSLGANDYDRLTGIDFRLISGDNPGQ